MFYALDVIRAPIEGRREYPPPSMTSNFSARDRFAFIDIYI